MYTRMHLHSNQYTNINAVALINGMNIYWQKEAEKLYFSTGPKVTGDGNTYTHTRTHTHGHDGMLLTVLSVPL